MRRFLSAGVAAGMVLLASAGCHNNSPTLPSDAIAFTAQLLPANVVPPVGNSESTAIGNLTMTMSLTRDAAGNITNATVDFQVGLTGFPTITTLTMAHLHRGNVGVEGPIMVDTGLNVNEVILQNGSGAILKGGIAVSPQLAQDLLNTPSTFYFDVHTSLNPGGALRGQLIRSQ